MNGRKFKTSTLWTVLNGKYHPDTVPNTFVIAKCIEIMITLFPGIKCNSKEEFYSIMNRVVIPALAEKFPWMIDRNPKKIRKSLLPVYPVMGSNGNQCLTDERWMRGFKKRIAA